MATPEDQCTQDSDGLPHRNSANPQDEGEEHTNQEIRQSCDGQAGSNAKESEDVDLKVGPTSSRDQLMPDWRQRRRRGSKSRKRGHRKAGSETDRGNRDADQEDNRTKDLGKTGSCQEESLRSVASDSEANLTVQSQDRRSILSSPAEWDPEGKVSSTVSSGISKHLQFDLSSLVVNQVLLRASTR